MKFNFNARKLKYGSASVVYVALFVAIIIVINIFAQFLTDRFSLKLDLTDAGKFSLSDETKAVLDEISEEINIYILASQAEMEKNENAAQTMEMIMRYNTQSGGKVKYHFIDPNKNPQFFTKYPKAKNSEARALVIEGAKRYTVLESQEFSYYYGQTATNKVYYETEEKLTSAILHVSSPEVSAAGFVTGHNEASVSALEAVFEGNHFEVGTVDLLSGVPENVNNLVISAPTIDFTAEEISAIESFLSQDGNSLYVFWGMATPKLARLEQYLSEWGFEFPSYVICDESNAYMSAVMPVCELAENEIIPASSQGELLAIFPRVRPINVTFGEKSGMRVVPLMQTKNTAYAKLVSADKTIDVLTRESGDVDGPFVVAALAERALGSGSDISRVVAIGSEAFAAEEIAGASRAYNSTFLSEIADYTNPDTLTMNIAPKVETTYDLNITEAGARVLRVIIIYIIPLFILALGVLVFIRRKNK